ncbi:hypothetical protein ACFLIN_03710 [Corynebacterium kutscheri]|uniref:glycine-rich domain-containing protein n=1 Tax=Corynebacterium kutscheri TaxID=35755 RepID=UPI0037C020C2
MMSVFYNGRKISELWHNGKRVAELWHNGKRIYKRRTEPLVKEFLTPGSFTWSVPSWASKVVVLAVSGGWGGHDGDGSFASTGSGGGAGGIDYQTFSTSGISSITGTVGRGGKPRPYSGSGDSPTSTTVTVGTQKMSIKIGGADTSGQNGSVFGWGTISTEDARLMQLDAVPGVYRGDSGKGLYAGPGGSGNGKPGKRGGGGSGGNGGFFNNFTAGGKGGDGFVRLIFWP